MQKGAIKPEQKVVIVDDLLATGGTYPLATRNFNVTAKILPFVIKVTF